VGVSFILPPGQFLGLGSGSGVSLGSVTRTRPCSLSSLHVTPLSLYDMKS
jgi:hypothetical protein